MNASINLNLFESIRILFEAAATDNELFRIIDADIRKTFFIKGDPIMMAVPADDVDDVTDIFTRISAAEARRRTGDENIPDVEDTAKPVEVNQAQNANAANQAQNNNEEPIAIVDYIRAKAIAALTYPPANDGMGIGNSREAKIRLGKIYGSKQKPKPVDPKTPAGKWLWPPDEPDALAKTQYEELLANPANLPSEFRNYISFLARPYLPGIIRIGFQECGLAQYLFYRWEPLRRGLIKYYSEQIGDQNKLEKFIETEFPPEWNYNRMRHFAQVVIPQLTIKSKLAPVEATANCDRGLLKQNIDYLGKDNVDLIQELVDPIEVHLGPNLDLDGSRELSYKNLLKIADVSGFNLKSSVFNRSLRPDGTFDYYTPKNKDGDDTDIENVQATFSLSGPVVTDTMRRTLSPEALDAQIKEEANLEYPATKIGDWYVEQVAKDTSDEDVYGSGWFTFNEPSAGERHQFLHRPYNDLYRGLGHWCWTGSLLENYRIYNRNDVAYAIVHKSALDPDVLKDKEGGAENNGSKYDATAFGIVIAGGKNNYPNKGIIPGLVKATTFEARNDTTYEEGRPGMPKAVTYPSSIVPYGGKIPGLIPIQSGMSNETALKIHAINNSIFSLALIGKWDPGITVRDADGTLHPENLIPLMQAWFPADISDAKTTAPTGDFHHRYTRIKSSDINEMANDIEHIINSYGIRYESTIKSTNDTGKAATVDDSIFRKHIFQLNGVDYAVVLQDSETLIAIPADIYMEAATKCNGDPKQILSTLDDEIDPAVLLFFYPASGFGHDHVFPYTDKPIALSEVRSISAASFNNKRYRISEARKARSVSKHIPNSDENGIKWFPPLGGPNNRQRRIGVNIDNGVQLFISGPDTEGKATPIDGQLPSFLRTFKAKGSYIQVQENGYNLFFNLQSRKFIGYARNGKIKWYFITFGSTFSGTSNALLNPLNDNGTIGDTMTLGNLNGNLANRMRATMKDRYTKCIDWVSVHGEVVDDVDLTSDFEEDLQTTHPTNIGLCVPAGDFNGDPKKSVGIIDWYDINTLEYVDTTPVFIDDLNR
jgi:hypothetical protein